MAIFVYLTAISFSLQGLGFGSTFFTAYIFFVTLYLCFLITLNTVTPGGRYNDGCFQKLSQTFIFHHEAEKSLCPNSRVPSISPGQLGLCYGTGERSFQAGQQKSLWDRAIGPVEVFISEPPFPIYAWRFL